LRQIEHSNDTVCALLPFVMLTLYHTTHPGCTGGDEIIIIVDQVCFCAYDNNGHTCGVVRDVPGSSGRMVPCKVVDDAGRGSVDGSV
jgi:hypothetical protein